MRDFPSRDVFRSAHETIALFFCSLTLRGWTGNCGPGPASALTLRTTAAPRRLAMDFSDFVFMRAYRVTSHATRDGCAYRPSSVDFTKEDNPGLLPRFFVIYELSLRLTTGSRSPRT